MRRGSHCDLRAQGSVMGTQVKKLLDHSDAGKGREDILLCSLQSDGRLDTDFRLDKNNIKMHFCCFKLPSLLFVISFVLFFLGGLKHSRK